MSSRPHGQPRPYRAGRRAETAAETRAAILEAALRLFLERGYGKVTVGDIARESGTAVPTVYASTGGKASILAHFISEGIGDPIVDQTLSAVNACRDPRETVAVATHGVRVDNEQYFALLQVLNTAAALDETAAETLARANRVYREALAVVAGRLEELGALRAGLTRGRATDILWFFLGHPSWRLYVADCRWSWNETEQWLAQQVSAALLDDGIG
ncbi:TetR/AcrR family transcriptional regulator [Streptomyces sp. GQFP]|uniref:TetR/AcrR family transcriptional regulator n=1 Tax=Streptomyces sp. GQFP TaxID=2907545 RepID=UPI001F1F4923|nr:TetR/AcrR family transcriptional regulator [Streptomyces sp. GQFP]UIX31148.1 TetR/AcrR family transcriptional regulator; helix-turn-helix transcriptional regulator [Streptomyces sp. GQFP]